MRTGHLTGTAVAAALLLGMTGCVGGEPLPTLPPTPSTTPVFASEEEALAAAEEAYAAYSEVSDLIAQSGGADPERIQPYVTDEQYEVEVETADLLRENGWRSVGSATTTQFVLQQYLDQAGTATITAYVCVDVSTTRVVDGLGNDVTPADRDPIVPLEVELTGAYPDQLRVARSEQWPDSSFC